MKARFSKPRVLLLLLHGLSGIVNLANAQAANRTIDDEYGDEVTGALPVYSPPGAWHQGASCDGCMAKLDKARVFGGTWHDATMKPEDSEQPTVTVQFNGSAVYVFCSLVQQGFVAQGVTALTSARFLIDGEPAGEPYLHVPTIAKDALYRQPIYSNSALESGPHTLTIQVTHGPDNAGSLLLFDYVLYTIPSPNTPTVPSPNTPTVPSPSSPTSSQDTQTQPPPATSGLPSTPTPESRSGSSNHAGQIAGGIVGGVGALVLGFLVFFLIRRRARDQPRPSRDMVDLQAVLEPLSPSTPGARTPMTPSSVATSKRRSFFPRRAPPPASAVDQREVQTDQTSALETVSRQLQALEQSLRRAEAPPPYEESSAGRGARAVV